MEELVFPGGTSRVMVHSRYLPSGRHGIFIERAIQQCRAASWTTSGVAITTPAPPFHVAPFVIRPIRRLDLNPLTTLPAGRFGEIESDTGVETL